MTPTSDEDRVIAEHLAAAIADLIAVYRFGSTATASASAGSDTDIAILAGHRLAPERLFEVQEALAQRLRRDVDLVDLGVASTVFAMQVVAHGRVVLDNDPATRGAFEDRTFSAYARLNEERRGILERIAAEGTVYGR
jgi:predicted nucleotidyltransferase